jgi:hypothetical protein
MSLNKHFYFVSLLKTVLIAVLVVCGFYFDSQAEVIIKLNPALSHNLTLQNLTDITIVNDGDALKDIWISGVLKLRSNNQSLKFAKQISLSAGENRIALADIKNVIVYSSADLRNYAQNSNSLPNGEFEYCVYIIKSNVEISSDALAEECLYGSSSRNELLSLVSPNDNAKISEYYPSLVWTANLSSFQDITYRLRLAEKREDQNALNAVLRNRALVDISGIIAQMETYPVTAQPLELWHRYAWTVDAYYKSLLIASAEAWSFCLVDDSILAQIPKHQDYLDIRRDKFLKSSYAVGELKLFYDLSEARNESLKIILFDADQQEINLHSNSKVSLKYGNNNFIIKLNANPKLKHLKTYKIRFTNASNLHYDIDFTYINPDFLN